LLEFLDGGCAPYNKVSDEGYPHFFEDVDFHVHNLIGQTETGYTVLEDTTHFVQSFEYRHVIAVFGHITGKRKTSRS